MPLVTAAGHSNTLQLKHLWIDRFELRQVLLLQASSFCCEDVQSGYSGAHGRDAVAQAPVHVLCH